MTAHATPGDLQLAEGEIITFGECLDQYRVTCIYQHPDGSKAYGFSPCGAYFYWKLQISRFGSVKCMRRL